MTDEPAELMPIGRFDWERIIRRVRMHSSRREVALLLATWADPDGSRVRPGRETLATVLDKHPRTVTRILDDLRDWGFIQQTRRGGGRGGSGITSEYQLTCPTDLLDGRFDVLGPDLRPDPPTRPDEPESGDTQMSPQSDEDSDLSPVDNDHSPVDKQTESVDNTTDSGLPTAPNEGTPDDTSDPNEGTSRCPTTSHLLDQTRDGSPTQRNLRPRELARDPPARPIPAPNDPDAPPEPT